MENDQRGRENRNDGGVWSVDRGAKAPRPGSDQP